MRFIVVTAAIFLFCMSHAFAQAGYTFGNENGRACEGVRLDWRGASTSLFGPGGFSAFAVTTDGNGCVGSVNFETMESARKNAITYCALRLRKQCKVVEVHENVTKPIGESFTPPDWLRDRFE